MRCWAQPAKPLAAMSQAAMTRRLGVARSIVSFHGSLDALPAGRARSDQPAANVACVLATCSDAATFGGAEREHGPPLETLVRLLTIARMAPYASQHLASSSILACSCLEMVDRPRKPPAAAATRVQRSIIFFFIAAMVSLGVSRASSCTYSFQAMMIRGSGCSASHVLSSA